MTDTPVKVFDAEAAATEGLSEKREIGRRIVEHRGQGAAGPVRFGRSIDRQDARMKLHVVEHRHQRPMRIGHSLLAHPSFQVWACHLPDNRAWPNEGNLDNQIIKPLRIVPWQ